VFRWLRFRFEVKQVVYGMSEILLAAEIALRRLYRRMPQQELNLLQLSSAVMTQLRAGPPQVVGCDVLQSRSPTAGPDHVPHDILRDSSAPHLSRSRHGAEDLSLCDSGRSYPLIERRLDPCWNRHRADVAALADQVYDCPVSLAHLDLIHLQAHQLRSANATTKKHGQHRVVALRAHGAPTRMLEHFGTLFCAQPVAGAESELLNSSHSANPGSQFRTEQPRVSSFVS
jgi:hypothetical protein